MKMSEKSYKMFTDFYNLTVEKASDEDVQFILKCVVEGAKAKKANKEVNYNNPLMCKENYETIKHFFEDFLNTASDDDAIYLIEGLKALCKEVCENKKKVEKFVSKKKEEASKNAKKSN